MQAIILAAGMGRRLGEYTKDNTKCMLPVNGVKLIDRVLTQLSSLSLNRVVIVVGYKGQNLINYIGNRYDDQLRIEYVNNPIYDKTNNIYSLALAKDKLQEDDTLLIESDLIFDDGMLQLIMNNPHPNLALVAKYESWMDGTMVRIDGDNNIVNFVPKAAFDYAETDSYYKTVNIYKFSKEFAQTKYVPFLDAYTKAIGNNEYYENVLRIISFLNSHDYCYLVNPYFNESRIIDEMEAYFRTLIAEYPSGMKVNTLLASKCWGVKEEYIIPGNGAAELIKVLMEKLPGTLGIIRPTFEEYPNRRKKEELVTYIPQNSEYRYTAKDLMQFFGAHHADNILLINPDNPSGNYIPVDDVISLAAWCQNQGIRLIVDESFVDFSIGFENNTLLHDNILEAYPQLVVMKSISKSYGVPGIRLGILCSADKELIAKMKKEVSIWNINSFAEYFMQIFTKYEKDYKRACEKFIAEREDFEQKLKGISFLRVMPSQANYFLCEILPPKNANQLVLTMLKKYNILLRDCSDKQGFDGKQYMRIAVRCHEDNARLIQAFKELEK